MAKQNDNPYGDDAGTRVGRPHTPERDNQERGDPRDSNSSQRRADQRDKQADGTSEATSDTSTGAGQEASRSTQRSNNKSNNGRPGSEPIQDRSTEAKSGYGGDGGKPRKSSDQK